MVETPLVREIDLPRLLIRRGKVRDIFDLGDRLLIVATDRLSAFDVVLPDPIPQKGRVLTALSKFWFDRFAGRVPHHCLRVIEDDVPSGFESVAAQIRGRAMLCRKAKVVPIECVARGYLAGSGWLEYRAHGTVCGIRLPSGLRESDQLPQPIFTPAIKAESGHDENVSFDRAAELVGRDLMARMREITLSIYCEAREDLRHRGILLADTKFEFGLSDGVLLLIDEVLTPDSSRFWPADRYAPGRAQESFDKQFVRDYLQARCDAGAWDKTPPAPTLPPDIIRATTERYLEALERITGAPRQD
ncbi:MAG: phosphoribosylaminoimidazolesuccinocarboxamide synthase [Phycisphaerae bacterium]